ncbi:MAG: chemotaxis-specific protein-glutamate methyltransferase CheB [Oscillospiraceae bacterium]|nr:chemotaxis-specific protein-glutamate methyltransferase CheB [Oscillospiraceae bacterium]
MPRDRIRVLVVDDSLFFRSMLVRGLSEAHDIEVVGEAFDPYDARDRLLGLEPDIMTLDIEMPNMNGVEFLKILLPQWQIPVVVVSSRGDLADSARRAGAADFLQKPADSKNKESLNAFLTELPKRVRAAFAKSKPASLLQAESGGAMAECVVALGASTGGTQATAKIVQSLPTDFPGMVVVQHMPPDFTKMYASNLDRDCRMHVAEARDGEKIEQGKVLVAPGGGAHMEIQHRQDGNYVRLSPGEKVSGHCPSVDKLFLSMARQLPGRRSVGVILTGMGADGARGLLAMRGTGSYTIGQDEKSSVVYGMPREAFELGAVTRQSPLDGIAELMIRYVRNLK